MNGEVNGTMEASIGASDNPPVNNKIVASEECNSNESTESHGDNSGNSEKSNSLNESTDSSITKSNGELIDSTLNYGDNSFDSCSMDQKGSKDPLNNHCSNSIESCSVSAQSSTKNKDISLNKLKSKDAQYKQICDKTDTKRTGVSFIFFNLERIYLLFHVHYIIFNQLSNAKFV